jgi:hypothetical protein
MYTKWRIKKGQGHWLLYMPYETRPLAFGTFKYCVDAMNYAYKTYYMSQTKRWRDG